MGGFVQFKGSTTELLEDWETHDALDAQPAWRQIAIPLAGIGALLTLGLVGLGSEILPQFLDRFSQIAGGPLSPEGDAQQYLRAAGGAFARSSFLGLLGLVAVKAAAFNLLPLPALNSGDIVAMLVRKIGIVRYWPVYLTRALTLLYLAMLLSWVYAFGISGRQTARFRPRQPSARNGSSATCRSPPTVGAALPPSHPAAATVCAHPWCARCARLRSTTLPVRDDFRNAVSRCGASD